MPHFQSFIRKFAALNFKFAAKIQQIFGISKFLDAEKYKKQPA